MVSKLISNLAFKLISNLVSKLVYNFVNALNWFLSWLLI
jgi:hypothetical protein